MNQPIESATTFCRDFDVSRETMARFEAYLGLLDKWNPRINLVSAASLEDVWVRHVADSAQLWALRPANCGVWLDLGSGAGFPGIVVALLARMEGADFRMCLAESDQRKCAFLRTVAAVCQVDVTILSERIERIAQVGADVISARALAPLGTLLSFAEIHRAGTGICLFPKGRTVHKEIVDARRSWRFDARLHPSRTDPEAAIVEIGALERV